MTSSFYLVGIGASAGGHEAIWEFFSHIPPTTEMAFVIVQHPQRDVSSVISCPKTR
jgi:two-component system CheB/CheR fusion protein